MNRHPDIAVLATEKIHSVPIFDVLVESVRLPSGMRQDLLVVDQPCEAVAVAAELEDGRLLLVRQYRHATGDWLVEIPAGRLEPGESPQAGAARELEEETGYRAAEWTALQHFFLVPGLCTEAMTLFHARKLEEVGGGRRAPDPDEELEVLRLSPKELLSGQCRDAKTLLAASLLQAAPGRP